MATIEELTALGNLCQCAWESTKDSRWKETTQRYIADMLTRNLALQEEITTDNYKVGKTIDFTLNERGHIRQIEAPIVRDRIVQKALMKQVLAPSLIPYLIYDNYASMKRRGTSLARKRFEVMLQRYIRKNGTDGYILLIDVRKYFESIDHETLKNLVASRIANEPDDIMRLISYIIDKSSHSDRGLNLGSEDPQIFAVYYLNPVDQFVKVVKGMRYYGRYMDDIFIIAKTKEELKLLLGEIRTVLSGLMLDINTKKTHIVKLTHSFTFLQIKYTITQTGHIIKSPSREKIIRERRKLKAFKRLIEQGLMTENDVFNCYQSWRGGVIADHNACYHEIKKMDALYKRLFPDHQEPPPPSRRRMIIEINRELEPQDLRYLIQNQHISLKLH